MKRRKLIAHLRKHQCEQIREGSKHSLWVNQTANAKSTVPRHNEIVDWLGKKICKDLQIPSI